MPDDPIDPNVVTNPPGYSSNDLLGVIYWPKSMGRPNTHRLSDGFSVVLQGHVAVSVGPAPDSEFGEPLTPKLRDGDGGPDHWRVDFTQHDLRSVAGQIAHEFGFVTEARREQIERESTYLVTVIRRDDVQWTHPTAGAARPVRVDPRHVKFVKYDEGPYVLPDFGLTDRP